jgi:hypothetical protein
MPPAAISVRKFQRLDVRLFLDGGWVADKLYLFAMGHRTEYKPKLLARMKRIRGQMDAVERALDEETDCAGVLQRIAARVEV